MLSNLNRHSMQISLFLFICVIATFAIIEAVPWYRQENLQRYEKTDFHGSSNKQQGLKNERYIGNVADRDVEFITSTVSNKRGGGYNNGATYQNGGSYLSTDEYQGGEQEQGVGEDLDENGYQGGREYQVGYGKHNARGRKSGRRDQDDSSDSESEDDEVPKRSKQSCRGCRLNNIGNGRKNYNRVYMYD